MVKLINYISSTNILLVGGIISVILILMFRIIYKEIQDTEPPELLKFTSKKEASVELDHIKTEVLKIYENQSIMVPLDIVEELQYFDSYDKKEILDFIESHRYNWKQENNKKVFKGDLK